MTYLYSRFYMKLWNYFWSTYVGMSGLLKKKELIVPAGHSFFTIFRALHWLLRAQNIHQRTFLWIEINQRPSVSSLFPVIYNEQLKMVTLFPSLPASPANNAVSKLNVVFDRSEFAQTTWFFFKQQSYGENHFAANSFPPVWTS